MFTTQYLVSFNANGGSGSMGDVEKDYGSTYDLPANGFTAPSGKVFDYWAEGSASGTSRAVGYSHTVSGNITFYAVWRDASFTDYVFSCAELTLTPKLVTSGTPVFITSAASKTVRSQDSILIVGRGLTPSTALTFPGLPAQFEIKSRTYTSLSTDASGAIDAVAYIFYTPAVGDTDDGLDEIAGITVQVEGAKPKTASLTQSIIGRHLPAEFVIAGKKSGKWWALPSNMANTTNPKPSEIAVNDYDNPSIAYTATSNIYGLEGPTKSGAGNNIATGNGQYIRLTMSIEDGNDPAGPAPLFGSATGTRTLGKSSNAKATNDLSAGWWWQLKQTNTSITNPQDAKYTIYCANNTSSLSLRDNAGNPDWGLFASGVEELRLIPASDVPFTGAYMIEWGQHGAIIEVDAVGINATKVKAILNNAESNKIALAQTLTSTGKSSKYNYTVDFGDATDFAAPESNGKMLTLEWYDGNDAIVAVSNVVVPKIIAANATMSSLMSGDEVWRTEVHVLPGVTLSADAGSFSSSDVTIKQLEIYPGATVKVTTGTLDVTSLVLRNGWKCIGGRSYDVARLYVAPSANLTKSNSTDKWYMDWYIDFEQYYPIAVPWQVTVSEMSHRYTNNTASVGPNGSIRLRYYDGAQRAASGQTKVGQNWKDYGGAGNLDIPTYLEPSKGYSFSARRPSGKAFSIVRMPLNFPGNAWTASGEQGSVGGIHKDQVTVTAYGKGTAVWYAMGWNFVGNPYMATFNGNDDGLTGKMEQQEGGSIRYATVPSPDFSDYVQVNITEANLQPAYGFFVQGSDPEGAVVTFSTSKIVAPSAPARFTTTQEKAPEQEVYIRLSDEENMKDQMGLIIGEDYTAAYEPNADLVKVLGDANALKTYMHYTDMDMAYVAINEQLAKEWIPVTVRIPSEGSYTFSLTNASEVEQLEGVYLMDYQYGVVTNLIGDTYSFHIEEGVNASRFAINAVVGQRDTPTGLDALDGKSDSSQPIKFLYRDNVYILHNGVIYDATGKKVREINK